MVPEVRETHIFGPSNAPPPSSQRKVAPGLGQKQWSLLTWDKAGLPGATGRTEVTENMATAGHGQGPMDLQICHNASWGHYGKQQPHSLG